MAINLQVQADVIDLRTDQPQPGDIILIDTNIWLWLTYGSYLAEAHPYQAKNYPSYVTKARQAKSYLLWCGLTLAEMAHNIERLERTTYNRSNSPGCGTKEYRHNLPMERARVVSEIQAAWGLVKSIGQFLEVQVDGKATDTALSRLSTQPLDGYDLFLLEAMAQANVTKLLTDDGDFTTVPGIQVFTANNNVLQAARTQGKLLIR